jgi:large conductance mechanosensitive channel
VKFFREFLQEFKDFISRGNVLDLAVAVIIGAAFGAITTSLVNDLITPILSLATGGVDFSQLSVILGKGEMAAAFRYGNFLQALINFLFISIIVFLLVKAIGKILRMKAKVITPTKICPYCASSIPEAAVRCPSCTTVLDEEAVPPAVR